MIIVIWGVTRALAPDRVENVSIYNYAFPLNILIIEGVCDRTNVTRVTDNY